MRLNNQRQLEMNVSANQTSVPVVIDFNHFNSTRFIQFDLEKMVASGQKFDVGNLGSLHHKLSLNAFTSKALAAFSSPLLALMALATEKIITQHDLDDIAWNDLGIDLTQKRSKGETPQGLAKPSSAQPSK